MRDLLRYKKSGSKNGIFIPIATKLILSFLLIIVLTSAIFTVVGIQLISNRIVSEAQEKVRYDLDTAREIYLNKLGQILEVVRSTADRSFLKDAMLSGDMDQATDELIVTKISGGLDILTITDKYGRVLLRTNNPELSGDDKSYDELVKAVLSKQRSFAATTIVAAGDLRNESPQLAENAHIRFIDTPDARAREETEETDGMMLEAAAPILDSQNDLIGVVYGGVLLNRNIEIVYMIKQTVFHNLRYDGKDIGIATIYQDDVGISTYVKNMSGSRAIGTRVTEDVFNKVVNEGQQWIGRDVLVNDWYFTAYEPIKNFNYEVIGILQVGILEQKYLDIKNQTIVAFLAITFIGALVSMLFSYVISLRISVPIKRLVSASRDVAHGNLDAEVDISSISNDELGELAEAFNAMASTLKERDEELKEFTRNKIMESERLALIGQLSANVAHELNNPLQGIVTYSHLLLEKMPPENPNRPSIQTIVTQANRCRDIIRGLLDFSRQRKPDKTLCDVNAILQDCVSLLEYQALFHNTVIIKEWDAELPMAIIDPSQIERVFMNITINAAEAMDGNGRLTLATRFDPVEQCIEIRFSDTGHGIAEENFDIIFDPFFTTKEVGHGTGLGLAISYGIVKEHKGTILVESEVGKGTTFRVRLPVSVERERVKNGG